jgi:hypothetical protein
MEIYNSDWIHKFQNKTGLDAKANSELYKSKRVCSACKNLRFFVLRLILGCPLLCYPFVLCVLHYRWQGAIWSEKICPSFIGHHRDKNNGERENILVRFFMFSIGTINFNTFMSVNIFLNIHIYTLTPEH